jgi:hypothetical protein
MRVWVEDLTFHFACALRAVGIGLAAVAWASALSSEAQQSADIRTWVQVVAAIIGVCIAQWFMGLPPSATVVDLLKPFERDILTVARDQARGDTTRMEFLFARIALLAAVRIRRGGNVPVRDRRAWLRELGQLADHSDQT